MIYRTFSFIGSKSEFSREKSQSMNWKYQNLQNSALRLIWSVHTWLIVSECSIKWFSFGIDGSAKNLKLWRTNCCKIEGVSINHTSWSTLQPDSQSPSIRCLPSAYLWEIAWNWGMWHSGNRPREDGRIEWRSENYTMNPFWLLQITNKE